MDFNIDATLKDMLEAIEGKLSADWAKIKDIATGFFNDSKLRLETLAEARINNEISDSFLQKRLADEKNLQQANFDTLKIIAKSDAQQAINAAFDILENAIKKAIGI